MKTEQIGNSQSKREVFESLTPGITVLKGKVTTKFQHGVLVTIGGGLAGYVPERQLLTGVNGKGRAVNIGDTLTLKVTDTKIDRGFKITLSERAAKVDELIARGQFKAQVVVSSKNHDSKGIALNLCGIDGFLPFDQLQGANPDAIKRAGSVWVKIMYSTDHRVTVTRVGVSRK